MTTVHSQPVAPTPSRLQRLVVLDHSAELGGAELAQLRLIPALGPDIETQVVLFSDGRLRTELEAIRVPVDVVELDRDLSDIDRHRVARMSWENLIWALRLVPFLYRLTSRLRQLRPDVILTTSLKADLLAVLPACATGSPLVWHVHDRVSPDYLPPSMVKLVRWAARFPAAIIANSQATARTLPPGSTVAYPGFSPEQVGPARDSACTSAPVVGLIGRISRTKGQLEFVRAARQVLEHHPDVTFRIIGGEMFLNDDYATEVRAEIRRLGIDERVDWVGFVPDTTAELDRLDVFVHASPVPEPFGQVIVEAMIRGVPVVATRAGGVVEILSDTLGDLGILVPPGDSTALGAAILKVLDDPARGAEMAARARASALTRFPIAHTGAIVSSVLSRAARHPRPS